MPTILRSAFWRSAICLSTFCRSTIAIELKEMSAKLGRSLGCCTQYHFLAAVFRNRFCGENWGPFLTSPLGAKLAPRGNFCPPEANFVPWGWSYPLRVKFSVCPSILLNNRECSTLGVNEGVNIPPRGQISPQGWSQEWPSGPQGWNWSPRRNV
jgi:hypothetical protein